MTLLYMQGKVTLDSFRKTCGDARPPLDPKKCVFLFPGNSTHHTKGTTLFTIKAGAGLAQASKQIGTGGHPTLSLPTTSMERWSSTKSQQDVVQGAIEDLYRAVGAGYHLVLPVREHKNNQYFNSGLASNPSLEPNFWGGVQKSANKPLADYYTEQLNLLFDFIQQVEQNDPSIADNPFYSAYLAGQRMSENDPWLREPTVKNKAVNKKASDTPKAPIKATEAPPKAKPASQKPIKLTESPVAARPEGPRVKLAAPKIKKAPETFDQKMSGIITEIISNIQGDKETSRYTHFNSERKVKLLEGLQAFLGTEQDWNDEDTQRFVIALAARFCSIKRNPLHFWGTPHSAEELKAALGKKRLPAVDSKIHFSYLELDSLLSKNKSVSEDYENLFAQFKVNECSP